MSAGRTDAAGVGSRRDSEPVRDASRAAACDSAVTAAVSDPPPFATVKNRLPMPSVIPWLSVTVHEIVCSPLVSVVVSMNLVTDRAVRPGGVLEAGEQRLDVRALLVVGHGPNRIPIHHHGDRRPVDRNRSFGGGVSAQPKLTKLEPATTPPCVGVSMVPNGFVALALAQVIVRVPSSVEWPSRSCA